MRRREFITLLGGAAAAWPLAARAQQPAIPVIGYLHSSTPDGFSDYLRALRQSIKESGYVEGRELSYRISLGRERASRSHSGTEV
jgi:putative tryptophan/tyrosine transport system substrate-binding protein